MLIVFLDDKSASYNPSLIKSHFIRTARPSLRYLFRHRLTSTPLSDIVVVVRVEQRDAYGDASHLRYALHPYAHGLKLTERGFMRQGGGDLQRRRAGVWTNIA